MNEVLIGLLSQFVKLCFKTSHNNGNLGPEGNLILMGKNSIFCHLFQRYVVTAFNVFVLTLAFLRLRNLA